MIECEKGALTNEEIKNLLEKEEGFPDLKPSLACLKGIGGVPKGELMTVLGSKGCGKSGFIKTILCDLAKAFVKTCVILSEENSSTYKAVVSKHFNNNPKFLDNLYFTSMNSWPEQYCNEKKFFSFMQRMFIDSDVDVFIFDNFTTSFFGDMHISEQSRILREIKSMADHWKIGFIGVFHTVKGTDIYSRAISGEDVRGSATATNTSGYNLVMSTFYRFELPRSYLFIDKARYHPEMNQKIFELTYDTKRMIYTSDRLASHRELHSTMNEGRSIIKDKERI